MSWNSRRQQGKKGRIGKRYIQDGTFAGTSAGAPSLVPVFLISFFFCLFAFAFLFFFSNLDQSDDNDSTRGLTIICVAWAASFCARLTGRMDIGRWLHLLFPPGWLVPHFTVTANPEIGQPASQHGPPLWLSKVRILFIYLFFYFFIFFIFLGGVGVGVVPGLQGLHFFHPEELLLHHSFHADSFRLYN